MDFVRLRGNHFSYASIPTFPPSSIRWPRCKHGVWLSLWYSFGPTYCKCGYASDTMGRNHLGLCDSVVCTSRSGVADSFGCRQLFQSNFDEECRCEKWNQVSTKGIKNYIREHTTEHLSWKTNFLCWPRCLLKWLSRNQTGAGIRDQDMTVTGLKVKLSFQLSAPMRSVFQLDVWLSCKYLILNTICFISVRIN